MSAHPRHVRGVVGTSRAGHGDGLPTFLDSAQEFRGGLPKLM